MKDEKTNEKIVDEAAAKIIIDGERKKRIATCQTELQAVLEKYHCVVETIVTIQGNQINSQAIVRSID